MATESARQPTAVPTEMGAESLGFVIFGRNFSTEDAEKLWASVIGIQSSAFEKHGQEGLSRSSAVIEGAQIFLTVAAQRIDLNIVPVPSPTLMLSGSRIIGIPNLQEQLVRIEELARKLLKRVSAVVRLGLNISFSKDFNSSQECNAFLRSRVPCVSEGLTDVTFQSNRPAVLPGTNITINGVTTWQSAQAQSIAFAADSPLTTASFWVARCMIDVNNSPIAAGAGEFDQAAALSLLDNLYTKFFNLLADAAK